MYDIITLPDEALKKVLPKISIRTVCRLISAYPRAVGRTLLVVLSQSMSPVTVDFVREELSTGNLPSMHQIIEAEKEFLRTLREENLLPQPVVSLQKSK